MVYSLEHRLTYLLGLKLRLHTAGGFENLQQTLHNYDQQQRNRNTTKFKERRWYTKKYTVRKEGCRQICFRDR